MKERARLASFVLLKDGLWPPGPDPANGEAIGLSLSEKISILRKRRFEKILVQIFIENLLFQNNSIKKKNNISDYKPINKMPEGNLVSQVRNH